MSFQPARPGGLTPTPPGRPVPEAAPVVADGTVHVAAGLDDDLATAFVPDTVAAGLATREAGSTGPAAGPPAVKAAKRTPPTSTARARSPAPAASSTSAKPPKTSPSPHRADGAAKTASPVGKPSQRPVRGSADRPARPKKRSLAAADFLPKGTPPMSAAAVAAAVIAEEYGDFDLDEDGLGDRRRSGLNAARSKEVLAERRRQLVETRHREPGERPCMWVNCGRVLPSLESLVDHLHDDHLPAGPKTGNVCEWVGCDRYGETQISRFAIMQHLRRHTFEKPFLCTLPDCGARFSRIDNLHKHWRAHEEGKIRLLRSGGDDGDAQLLDPEPSSPPGPTGSASRRRGGGARGRPSELYDDDDDDEDLAAPTKRRRNGTDADELAAASAPVGRGQRRTMTITAGLGWYRRRCRQLAACFRHSLWENALLEADMEDSDQALLQLKLECRKLERRLLHLQLLRTRADLDEALDAGTAAARTAPAASVAAPVTLL